MLTFLLFVTIGAYASQRISIVRDGEIVSASFDYRTVWQDAIALFALIGSICLWVIGLAQLSRAYADCALLPWLAERFGMQLTLPTIALPTMPSQELS
ncbi:MAG: hypothetical protein KME10_02845 [Plectolyngbya sp. WJT66-NPBG17]|jgi:hypothetical protein|nr:hypothetical protein [Plectolyngbya sp. WJT66-NPBG17]